MRVPIYPDDLKTRHGFKRIAKKLQRQWPGYSSIQLSFAREILSQALGYQDYYDLLMASEKWRPGALAPSEEEITAGLLWVISAVIHAQNQFVTAPTNLLAFVKLLPLHTLVALKGQQASETDNDPLELSPFLKRPFLGGFVSTTIGFCNSSFLMKPDNQFMRCSNCSNGGDLHIDTW